MWIVKEGEVVDWTNMESVMDDGRVAQTTKIRQSTYSTDKIRLSMRGFLQTSNRTPSHTGKTTTLRCFDFEQR